MVSPHHVVKIATALSAVALTASVAVTPAYALQDIAIEDAVAQSGPVTADNGVVVQSDDQSDDQTGDQQSQDGMPDNPNAKLPDTVSDEISDDATVVSEDLAVTPEGEVKNIETGETVTDATLVGTQDQQPDPLAKTNGESFIPVSAEDVKNAVADANVQLSKFESNEYGAHWGTYNNTKAFFDYQNNLFVQQAKGVIDVSEWQGAIDALQVDLYDHEAAAPVLDDADFYRACRAVLTPDGCMTVNLFGRCSSFERSVQHMAEAFGADALWAFRPTREGNTVVLAQRTPSRPQRAELAARAALIEQHTGLPANKWLRVFRPLQA